jgi:hypothetical protein
MDVFMLWYDHLGRHEGLDGSQQMRACCSGPQASATKSLTPAVSPCDSTKTASLLLVVVVAILIIGAGGAGFFLSKSHSTQSSSTSSDTVGTSLSNSSTTESPITISYDTMTVGYKGGLFQLEFQVLEGKQISGVVAILNTPVQAAMCSGGIGSALGFGNCLPGSGKSYVFSPPAGGSFPANATFTGYDSGAGPGSATAGQSYPLSITVTYVDGTSSSVTVPVQAVGG